MQHKEVWAIDLRTGEQRQLTHAAPDFDLRAFDLSPDGRELALERVEESADVVLLDLADR